MISLSIIRHKLATVSPESSKLYCEKGFYPAFSKDIKKCQHELIIESPFITGRRVKFLLPDLKELKSRHVRVVVNTRDPESHDGLLKREAYKAVADLQRIGVQVIYTDGHHRKVAIIDRQILWEGSLNILSQRNSKEMMRRIDSVPEAWAMTRFIGIDRFLS